jgi:hypothetical protein
MPAQIPKELLELVEGGASILVGTRDEALRPECLRAVGAELGADRSTLVVYVPSELAARTIATARTTAPSPSRFPKSRTTTPFR